ncbi:MAG: O-antigen ligase family protein [Actinomycetaceae bacterium]|nr:O-antigen ligase family protein [Actinomycetaceae bacterium]MDO5747031.1 O-antigen ligase family protein [Actinomycetaceae bacterium]
MNDTSLSRIRNIVLNPVYCVSAYFVFFLINQMQIVNLYLGPTQSFLVLWAGINIVYFLVKDRSFFRVPAFVLLLPLLVAAGITFLVNRDVAPVTQIKSAVLFSIALLLVYPLGARIARSENRHRELAIAVLPALIVTFIQAVLSFGTLIVLYSFRGRYAGKVMMLGLQQFIYGGGSHATILFGFNVDSNHAALFSLVSLILTVWAYYYRRQIFGASWVEKHAKLIQRLFWLNAVLQSCFFILAFSRGAMLTLMVTTVIFTPLYVMLWEKTKGVGKNSFKKRLRHSVVVLLICFVAITGIQTLVRDVTNEYVDIVQRITWIPKHKTEDVPDEELSFSKGDATRSARTIIWEETLLLWQEYPVFGVGPYNSQHYAKEANITSEANYLQRGAVPHNSYLDVLVYYGAVGFVLYIVFFLRYMTCLWKRFAKTGFDFEDLSLSSMVIVIMLGVFFLTDSFVGFDYLFGTLLIGLGYLVAKSSVEHGKLPMISYASPPKER